LRDENIVTTLKVNGWDDKKKDPKYLFDLVLSCIGRVTSEARSEVLAEFLSIKRASFDSMHAFLHRYTILRKRTITDAKFNIDDDLETNLLYNATKAHYPVDAKMWQQAIEDKTMTVNYLMSKLSDIGNTEKRMSTNLTVQVKTTGTANTANNTNNKDSKGGRTRDEKIACTSCDKK
ncbi:hypothetical protein QBC32DRAFT_190983, partial [Pseudoneurospora amorphoporcata]